MFGFGKGHGLLGTLNDSERTPQEQVEAATAGLRVVVEQLTRLNADLHEQLRAEKFKVQTLTNDLDNAIRASAPRLPLATSITQPERFTGLMQQKARKRPQTQNI